jgi:inosose dehydratase
MLELVRDFGYTGIELGPPGYFGDDPSAVASLLDEYGLSLAGAFAPLRIADEDGFRADLAFLDATVATLAGAGATGPVVLAADENPTRLAVAGRPDARRETSLRGDDFKRAAARIERARERADARGVAAVFHPHTATYIEGIDELAALLEETSVDIALDTGHVVVGGSEPLEAVRLCGARISHLHLKDVDPGVLARVRSSTWSVEEAWENGLFCAFGHGAVDFDAVLGSPELAGFSGWIVLEQDRVAVLDSDLADVRDVEERNLAVVRRALRG